MPFPKAPTGEAIPAPQTVHPRTDCTMDPAEPCFGGALGRARFAHLRGYLGGRMSRVQRQSFFGSAPSETSMVNVLH